MGFSPVLTRIAGPGALGAVIALGQAPFGLWPLTVLGLAVASVWLGRCGGWRQAAGLGWMIGTGYFALALVWIVQPFFVDPWRHGWMAPFAILFMSAGLALFWGAGFAVARRLGAGALALAGAFTLAELARSYLFTGFPWVLTGHALVDTPLAQAAALAGAHGLGLLVLTGALGLRALWLRQWVGAGVAVLLLGAVWVWGADRLSHLPDLTDRPVLRLVQPNAPQHQKWNPDLIPVFFRRQVDFTAAGEVRPDLVVWPETALPVLLDDAERGFQIIAEAAQGVPVVLGIERLEDGALYNSAVRLRPDGAPGQVYDKHHLVPFGEYIPLGGWLSGLGLQGLAAKDGNGFAAGPGPALMDLGGGIGKALLLICYEAVFPGDVGGTPERPALLLQLTNDAWFGTFSGPYQHLAQARLRAIEQGLPLARAANTGVSAMIDPWGRITAQIPLGQAGWVDAALSAPLRPTLYARTGDLPVALLAVAMLLAAGFTPRAIGRRKSR
ncbi:apolipoprotein N-acyltransferase [Thalassovita sp.]|uniref:apolipoprotein N-acyltransferase n=1 Tax=Thalassovita sp. TaxID=1979401 RepID=UPI0029DE5683|nr:apolipoprotein N-acyltransferase [Thalassovita sp.]